MADMKVKQIEKEPKMETVYEALSQYREQKKAGTADDVDHKYMLDIASMAESLGMEKQRNKAAKIAYDACMRDARSWRKWLGPHGWREIEAIMSAGEIAERHGLRILQRSFRELYEGKMQEWGRAAASKEYTRIYNEMNAMSPEELLERVKKEGSRGGDYFLDGLQADSIRRLGRYVEENPEGPIAEKIISTIREISNAPLVGFSDDNYDYNTVKDAAKEVMKSLKRD